MKKVWISGFTLIELMIAVAVIGVLAAIGTAKSGQALRKAYEARTKGNLATLRSALSMYVSVHEGEYPHDKLQSLVTERFLEKIPMMYYPPYHPPGNEVDSGGINAMASSTEDLFYCDFPPLPSACGRLLYHIFPNCTHQDMRGQSWSSQ